MFIALVLYSVYPLYDFLFNGNLTLVCPLHLPLVDDTQLKGYLIESSVSVSIFVSACGVMHNYTFSLLFVVFVDVYYGMVYMMKDDLREFDTLCEINKQHTIPQRRAMFRNITLEAMDLARYIQSKKVTSHLQFF